MKLVDRYVRCHRCRRLCGVETASQVNGVYYGPECLKIALSTAEEQAELSDLAPRRRNK